MAAVLAAGVSVLLAPGMEEEEEEEVTASLVVVIGGGDALRCL